MSRRQISRLGSARRKRHDSYPHSSTGTCLTGRDDVADIDNWCETVVMKLHDATAEVTFEAKIDARFPYDDKATSSALIAEACSISLNALYCVLDEICRPPKSSGVTEQRQRELIAEWSSAFEHELKAPLVRCANALVSGQALKWRDAVSVIEDVGRFEAQRAALSVAYFAGDCDSDEGDAALDSAQRRVREAWEENGV